MSKFKGKSHWVHDYETLSNCFLAVFEHYKTDEVKTFVVHKLKNDLPKFIDFLKQNVKNDEWHISFNGLSFDSQITQYIIKNHKEFLQLSATLVAGKIYEKAQDCIARQNARQFQEWSEKQLSVKQIDVFKLNHWDNPAKRSSLKWIQISMDWHNVQDMPIDHRAAINTVEELQMIASYCKNDVSSTKAVMKSSAKQIMLRGNLTDEYGIRLYSASEPKIAKDLFVLFLSEKTDIPQYELRKMRTYRKSIEFKDIILPYIEFNDIQVMQDVLEKFKEVSLDPMNTRGGFKHSINYRGVKTDFGLGGIHGAKKGMYELQEGMTIMSSDVTSFYPRMAMVNQWSPQHLPKKAFCDQYQWFFDERVKIPKSDPRNYVYKIVLNSTYGLSNDQHSFLYDPEFTMRITVNGQLLLLMLYTMLTENIPGAVPIMQNTDGLETIIPTSQVENYLEICKQWEDITGLNLEHDEYQKLIVGDVNNYIGVFKYKEVTKENYAELQKNKPDDLYKEEAGKFYHAATKCKGRFEFKDRALHKNKSYQIIPKAIFNFFVHGVSPETYIVENRNIFDYIGGVKIRGDWKFMETYVEKPESVDLNVPHDVKYKVISDAGFVPAYKEGYWIKPKHDINKVKGWTTDFVYVEIMRGTVTKKELQKTLRFYVSNTGSKVIKENKSDGRTIQVISGKWMQTIFNEYEDKPWDAYDINDRFYLERIYKEIRGLIPEQFDHQTSLF